METSVRGTLLGIAGILAALRQTRTTPTPPHIDFFRVVFRRQKDVKKVSVSAINHPSPHDDLRLEYSDIT